jgi:microsomal dipeptidase-like Zn-dependent dipeptidase
MIVDLHSHYGIYLGPHMRDLLPRRRSEQTRDRTLLGDVMAAGAVRALGRIGNRATPWAAPRVTLERLRAGGCVVMCSVLYSGVHEFDLISLVRDGYGNPGTARYFTALLRQMDTVEATIERSQDAEVVRDMAELKSALGRGQLAVVHCVEGGFHLGDSPETVRAAVATLASRGVAYLTLAHLFWRSFSPNVPVLPLISPHAYDRLFPMPCSSLPELGRATIEEVVANGMLLDLTHMTEPAMMESIDLVASLLPGDQLPLLASHVGYRFGRSTYNLSAAGVRAITQRGGVVGVILSQRILSEGTGLRARDIDGSLRIVFRHVDKLAEIAGGLDRIALGSDLGGFIKPLPGLDDAGRLSVLGEALADRYGEQVAADLCTGNALRLLERHWRGRSSGSAEESAHAL